MALAAARAAFDDLGADLADRVTLVHDTFGNVAGVLAALGIAAVDGFVLDLGPSSPQLDTAERGFSFSRPGPIDMRMDPTRGESAVELIRRASEVELADLIFAYGEERYSRRIARNIKGVLASGQLENTVQLADAVAAAIPSSVQRRLRIHPATRTFQALRIAVNEELTELERFLAAFPDLLQPGGRCVIISFHSLEDRLVKRCFRDLAWSSRLPANLAEAAGERVHPIVQVLTRKAVFASDDEVARNPRARSARLRACGKLPN
jgi:16S rRNA (cytosine1402-N4)-methyltransferase